MSTASPEGKRQHFLTLFVDDIDPVRQDEMAVSYLLGTDVRGAADRVGASGSHVGQFHAFVVAGDDLVVNVEEESRRELLLSWSGSAAVSQPRSPGPFPRCLSLPARPF